MKKTRGAAVFLLIFAMAAPAFALELSMETLSGNLFFPWSQSAQTPGAFPTDNFFLGMDISVSDTVSDDLTYTIGYSLDPILRSLLSVMVTYNLGFAQFSAGPFLGAFNSTEAPLKSGLSTAIRLEWPGKLFASLRSDSSLGGGLLAKGDYIQETTEISAGWYVYNAICTLSMMTRKFSLQKTDTLQTQDSLTRYAFDVNVYRKGAPLTLVWTLGYQKLSKTWDSGSPATDTLGTILLGARADWRVHRNVRIIARLETGIYTFGLDDLVGQSPSQDSFLFNASLGVKLRLGGGVSGAAPSSL